MRKKQTPLICCICKSTTILALLLLVMATLPVASADEWSYRKSITISGSQVQGTVTNFPVLINLSSDSNLVASAQDDGGDIVFTNANNTVRYDHEMEKFVKSTGELVAWVEIDSLSSGSNTTIYMWYGNPDCADQWHIEATWDEGGNNSYKGVWHLLGDGTTSLPDVTSNLNAGTKTAVGQPANTASGQIDDAQVFDGTDDCVEVADAASLHFTNQITVETWIKTTESSAEEWVAKVIEQSPWTGFNLRRYANGAGPQFTIYNTNGNDFRPTSSTTIRDGNWHHVVGTYDGSDAKIFVDGVCKDTVSASGNIGNTQPLRFAYDHSGWTGSEFTGTMDEVRISATARNGDWIKTSYNNQNNPSTFYTVGSQVGAGPAPPVPDLPAIILFGAGLLAVVLYAVPRRRFGK